MSFLSGSRTRIAVAAASAALVLGAPPALALTTPPVGSPVTPVDPGGPKAIGTLDPVHQVLNFSGSIVNPTPLPLVNEPVPVVCAEECQEYQFTDATAPTPFLVAIQSTVTGPGGSFNADQGFDLYVYDRQGHLVGSANGIGANGQAVEVNPAEAGKYTIVVTFTYAYDNPAGWVGEVRLMAPTAWEPAAPSCGISVGATTGCFDLPTLEAVPAYDFQTSGVPPVPSTPLGFPFPVSTPTPTSCYADESLGLDNPAVGQQPVLRCLRFTTDIRNGGAGPLAVEIPAAGTGPQGQTEIGYVPGQCQAEQVVTSSTGQQVSRPAGGCEFHPQHAHFHYDGLLGYSLHQVAADGSIGPRVSSSTKESFCLTDDDYFGYGTPGPNGPRNYVGQPGCNLPGRASVPSSQPGSGVFVEEGITPGWGDVYTWDTPDQYVDVTNVPAGKYFLVEETNPSGHILVSGPPQTCAATEIQLTVGQSTDTVQELAAQPSVTCPTS